MSQTIVGHFKGRKLNVELESIQGICRRPTYRLEDTIAWERWHFWRSEINIYYRLIQCIRGFCSSPLSISKLSLQVPWIDSRRGLMSSIEEFILFFFRDPVCVMHQIPRTRTVYLLNGVKICWVCNNVIIWRWKEISLQRKKVKINVSSYMPHCWIPNSVNMTWCTDVPPCFILMVLFQSCH